MGEPGALLEHKKGGQDRPREHTLASCVSHERRRTDVNLWEANRCLGTGRQDWRPNSFGMGEAFQAVVLRG